MWDCVEDRRSVTFPDQRFTRAAPASYPGASAGRLFATAFRLLGDRMYFLRLARRCKCGLFPFNPAAPGAPLSRDRLGSGIPHVCPLAGAPYQMPIMLTVTGL